MNLGFLGKGNASAPDPLREQIAAIREHSATAAEMAARTRTWSEAAARYNASVWRWSAELAEYHRSLELSRGEGGA